MSDLNATKYPIRHLKRLILSGLAAVLIAVLALMIRSSAEAQGLVIVYVPDIQGTQGLNDYYISDVFVDYQLPPDAYNVTGCQDTLIDFDTNGVTVPCQFNLPQSLNPGDGSVLIKRDATPPVVVTSPPANQPLAVDEGSQVWFDASNSFDAASGVAAISWDANLDGIFDDGNPAVFDAIDGIAQGDTDPDFLVAQVADVAGNVAHAAVPVFVRNVAPAVVAPNQVTYFGGSITQVAAFSDPGVQDTHTAWIDWGDGRSEPGSIAQGDTAPDFIVASSGHVYAQAGVYLVTVTVTDKDGGVGQAVAAVTVQSPQVSIFTLVPAVNLALASGQINPGQAFSLYVKLGTAVNLVDQGHNLGAAGLMRAFYYEGTSIVEGDRNPDFLPALEIAGALEAAGGVTPSD